MKTLKELREQFKKACERVQAAAKAIDDAADDADFDALRSEMDAAAEAATAAETELRDREAIEEARSRFAVVGGVETREVDGVDVHVGDEPAIYRQDNQHERSFFADMFARDFNHDARAAERLTRHFTQTIDSIERRDVGTGAFAGLVIPQYLVDLYAPLARAGAPFVENCCTKLPLPAEGMTINISRLTTGTTTAAQATENAAVSETDADDTLLTVNVRTYAGQQDVSRQALERGTAIDAVLFQDLLRAYYTALDSGVLNADGNNGTHLGVRNVSGIVAVTYTDASPTVAEFYPKLADAIQQIASGVYSAASHIVMQPRRWGWLTSALDSSGRPFVLPIAQGVYMAQGVAEKPTYGQVVGFMQGLPVITDANLPTNLGAGTNEDVILVVSESQNLLWQEGDGTPRQARFEQTLGGNLTVKLVLYGYTAFTAGRYPLADGTISGTGLVTPTF